MAGRIRGIIEQASAAASQARDNFLIESAGAGGLRGLIGNVIAGDVTRQAGERGSIGSLVTMINQGSAPTRGTAELIQAYNYSPWLRAVVSRIAWSVAAVRWQLFVVNRNGRPVKTAANYATLDDRRQILTRAHGDEERQEILEHPLLDMIRKPNPFMNGLQMRKATQAYLDLKGEGIWVLERDKVGVPREIWVIPPHWMTEIASLDNPFYEFTLNTQRRSVPADDVVYFRDSNLVNPYGRGSGIGESLGDEIETDEFAAKYVKSFFHNSARPDMIVTMNGAKEDAARAAKRRFENNHKGWRKGRGSFWTGQDIKITTLGQSFHDMELTELRSWERDTFIAVYGIPPEILGITKDSNRATAVAAARHMAKFVTIPRLEGQREELQSLIDREFDDRIIIDYVDPSPDDKELELQYIEAAPWAATVGEIRTRQGLRHRGDEDDFSYVPVNLIPVESGESKPTTGASPRGQRGVVLELVGKILTESDIDGIIGDLKAERLVDSSRGLWEDQIEEWGNAELGRVGAAGVSFDMRNPLVQAHLAEFEGINIVGANQTTQKAIRLTLSEGIAAGEGVRQLKARVTETFGATGFRAERIARTEVLRSSNFATFRAHQASGVVEARTWLAAFIDTRKEHAALHNTSKPLDQPFIDEKSGATAMFPGGFGVAALDINCMCTTIPITITGRSVKLTDAQIQALTGEFIARMEPWVRAAIAAFERAFKQQKIDVFESMDRRDAANRGAA